MAPKGGKGGGGGGGGGRKSASCSECTAPLTLYGSDWERDLITAFFAIQCIIAVVLLACLILQTRFKWVRDVAIDKLRNTGYPVAAGSLFCAYILYIVDLALHEEQHTTTNLYYLTRILASALWRTADLLILGIIYRTIAESSLANLARKLSGIHKVLIILLTLLTLTAFGFDVALTSYLIRGSSYAPSTVTLGNRYTGLAYHAFYLIAALLAGVESLTVMLRARSKGTLLLLFVITPSLIIRSLFTLLLISLSIATATRRGAATSLSAQGSYNLRWASSYIAEIAQIGIWLGVVLVGFLTFRKGASRSGKYVGGAVNGGRGGEYSTSYTPVGGYARG